MNYYPCNYNTISYLVQQQIAHKQYNPYIQPQVNLQQTYQTPLPQTAQAEQTAESAQTVQQPYVVYMLAQLPLENKTETCYLPILFNSPDYPIIPYDNRIAQLQPIQVPIQSQPMYYYVPYSPPPSRPRYSRR